MKPTNQSLKSALQLKANIKPPTRIPAVNTTKRYRDVSPEPARHLNTKIDISNVNDTAFNNAKPTTSTITAIQDPNKATIAENLKSLSAILTKKSTVTKPKLHITRNYTYEICNSADPSDDIDKDVMRYLIAQKDEEIKNLRIKLEDAITDIQPFNLSSNSVYRPTEIDNTIFAFEEEKAKLEIRISQLQRELLAKDTESTIVEEQSSILKSKVNVLKKELQRANRQFSVAEKDIVDLKYQNRLLLTAVSDVEGLLGYLFEALNACLRTYRIGYIEEQYLDDSSTFLRYLGDSLIEIAEKKAFEENVGVQTSFGVETPERASINSIGTPQSIRKISESQESIRNAEEKPVSAKFAKRNDFITMMKDIDKLKDRIYKISGFIEVNSSFVLDQKINYDSNINSYE